MRFERGLFSLAAPATCPDCAASTYRSVSFARWFSSLSYDGRCEVSQLLRWAGRAIVEIGTGSGYQAAVLGSLAAEVYTIEIVPELAQRAGDALPRARLCQRPRASRATATPGGW